MEQQGSNEFLVELEKMLPSQIAMTSWAPNMDLLAIATFDQTIELFRISYKAQRVFQAEEAKPIKTIAFSLDSHLIAYGMLDGTVRIVKSENGQNVVTVEGMHSTEIQSLTFVNYHRLDPKLFMPFQKNSIQGKLILPVSPHKNCNKNAIIKINYFSHINDEFVFLLSSERQRTLFLLNGFIPVADINYTDIKFNNVRVHRTHYDGTFRAIVTEQQIDHFKIHLIEYDSTLLRDYHEDIIKFHCIIGYISEILNFVQGTFGTLEMQLRQIANNFNSKMGQIEDPNMENIQPCNQLFRFLNLGITSAPLVNFLTKSLFDSKAPQKLDQTLTDIFAKMHDLLLESTQNSLERAVVLLNVLKNMACSQRFKIFGVSEEDIVEVTEKVTRIYTMTEILLVQSTQTKFDIRNLLVWLNKSAIKTSQENDVEIENTKSYLNKYTVDYNRLHSFLEDASRFKLEHLRVFFSRTNETRGMKIQAPEFRLLHRTAPQINPEMRQNFLKMEKLLQVDDIILPQQNQAKNVQFYPFKTEMDNCIKNWKTVIQKPRTNISSGISKNPKLTAIGSMEYNELFPMEIKTSIVDGQFVIYYVERENDKDLLVKFNCHTKKKEWVFTRSHHIASIAIGNSVIVQLQQKLSGVRTIAEIVNKTFDGRQIVTGKQISKVNGEVDIDSSLRGLNSLIENKTKLIIFD